MFKKYLNSHNPMIRLSVFLFLWAAFFLITNAIQLLVINNIDADGSDFEKLNYLIQHKPVLSKILNLFNAISLFLIPAYLFAYLSQAKPWEYLNLHKRHSIKVWVLSIGFALVMIPTIVGLGGFIKEIQLFGAWGSDLQEQRDATMQLYFQNEGIGMLLMNLFLLAFIPAFCEEFLFRGVLQKVLAQNFKNPLWAISISAFVFALLHFSVYEFIPILLAGLILGTIYHYTKSLKLTILIHFVHNGMQVVLMTISNNNEEVEISLWIYLLVFIIGLLVLRVIFKQLKIQQNGIKNLNY